MNDDLKILLLGIGSIGGIIAGKLLLANKNCTLITNNELITNKILKDGIRIFESNKKDPIIIKTNKILTSTRYLNEKFDFLFFMMKTSQLETAIMNSKYLLKPNGFAVFFQNGIVEHIVYKHFKEAGILASVIFNSIMISPGVYILSKSEKIIIGKIAPQTNDLILSTLQLYLSEVVSCEISFNIIGITWSKLAINCSINAITAISGQTLGKVLKKKFGKEIFFSIYKETVNIADKLGIKLEKIKIDPYMLYADDETSFYKRCIQILLINQIAKSYSSIYPSMLQDIKKGKKTEIDFLNGFISDLGRDLKVATPINDEMTSLVKKIERNYLKPDISLLRIAYELPQLEKSKLRDLQIH